MKIKPGSLAVVLAAAVGLYPGSIAAAMGIAPLGQAFTGAGMVDASGGSSLATIPMSEIGQPESSAQSSAPSNLAPNDPASKLCADGTRAIDQGRWADAVDIFSKVAALHADHADGALYWKAYAENKLGKSKASQEACAQLRAGFPKSRWIDDCGALEVEIRARSGKRVEIDPNASDDVKLLALNTMLHQNEALALAQIQEILKGDSSPKLKKEAQFILGTHYSDVTYAQIVRISSVEGDVRIQRGEPSSKAGNALWEQAVAGLPLETGFSLVTGQGRAEIEFENASTIYLGENSVLTFNDLHETAGIPFTELGLLSGTVSLYFQPYVQGEKLILHTPSNDFISRYQDKSFARIEAFTNAVNITPLPGGNLRLPSVSKEALEPGRTWTYLEGKLVDAEGAPATQEFAAWDSWVEQRVDQRRAAINSVLEASGLAAPIPGLADLAGQGKFFDCAPYGTCWEPNDQAEEDDDAGEQSVNSIGPPPFRQEAHLEVAAYHPGSYSGSYLGLSHAAQNPQTAQQTRPPITAESTVPPELLARRRLQFPCMPEPLLYRTAKDPATGKYVRVSTAGSNDPSYGWAVCHAGAWIRHHKHYAWVAGGKRHHICPVRWVKSGKTVGFVPLHPYDVKGQPAINARHEVFAVAGKGQFNDPVRVVPVRFEQSMPITYLKAPPREYAVGAMRPLAAVEAPRMEAHALPGLPGVRGEGNKSEQVKGPGGKAFELARVVPIHFDAKEQAFMVAREEMRGGRSTTVMAPMTNHSGSLQARSESFSGGSSFHGNAGGGSAGSSHGGSGSSAGSRGGGGASSSGGGSHGVGASSSSSSTASSAASSSGSHH
jgi:hypothetical protein